jgi:ABC-type multidrug transport system fused ATPase/permease subunit
MKEKKSAFSYLKIFWKFVKPYKKPLRVVYILFFLNAGLNLLPAYSIRFFIDYFISQKKLSIFGINISSLPNTTSEKIIASFLFLGVMAIIIIIANSIGVAMHRRRTRNVEKVIYDIKQYIHEHINKLSLGYIHNERVGTIITKAVGDVNNLSLFLNHTFDIIYFGIQLIFAPILMITLSPILFLISIIPLPFVIFALYNIRVQLKPLYHKQRENESLMNSNIQETVSGLKEIKAFNMEQQIGEYYGKINKRYYNVQNRIMKIFSFNHQLQYGSKDFSLVLITVIGGIFIFLGVGNITIGIISSSLILSQIFYIPINYIVGFYDILQRGLVSLERIVDFLNVEPDIKDKPNAVTLQKSKIKGAVSFKNISFYYSPQEPVLNNITFNTKPGEKVAIVGSSGSGKSTLISLLTRFYEPIKGNIYIDGMNIQKITQKSLRSCIGIVFQETYLFYGTIKDNLLFVNPYTTEKEIFEALDKAELLDTINQFSEGINTFVGERGTKLSGGQRQRMSIARILLKDPAIVILDEATSSLDTTTEKSIQKSIDLMLKGRTAFIIAHRLSTIQNCDRIFELNNYSIKEINSYEDLLEKTNP